MYQVYVTKPVYIDVDVIIDDIITSNSMSKFWTAVTLTL